MNVGLAEKQTSAAICTCLDAYTCAAGGLGMADGTKAIRAFSAAFRSGDKRIVFVGTSNSGKSTLINAMLGNCLLHTAMQQDTAVVTHIEHGQASDVVRIRPRNSGLAAGEMPVQRFFQEYRASDLTPEALGEIDHAALQTPFQKDGLVFVDTPDFQLHPKNAEAIALETDLADAVVLVLHGGRLLDLAEQRWIRDNLTNANRKKVFFAVNWSELISEDDFQALDIHLRNGLASILVDQTGRFSQGLFDRRVFYIDALLAENARTGKMAAARKLGKQVLVPVPPEDQNYSGVPELEKALEEFLARPRETRGYYDRCIEWLQQLNQRAMALRTEKNIQFQQKLSSLEQRRQELTEQKNQAEKILEKMQQLFHLASQELTAGTMKCYDRFLQECGAQWEAYAQTEHLDFGMVSQTKIAGLQLKQGFRNLEKKWSDKAALTEDEWSYQEELNQIVKPVTDAAYDYLDQHLRRMLQAANAEADRIMAKYVDLLNRQCEALEKIDSVCFSGMDALKGIIAQLGNNGIVPRSGGSGTNMILSLVLFQNTAMAYDMMFHNISVDKLLQEGIERKASMLMVDITIGILTGGGYWAGMLLHEAYLVLCRIRRADQYGKEIFCSFKEPVLGVLNEARDYIVDTTRKIHEENLLDLYKSLNRVYLSRIELARQKLEQNLQELYSNRENARIDTDFEAECVSIMEAQTRKCISYTQSGSALPGI